MTEFTVKKKMNIMFDLHGVIGEYPDLFKPFMKSLRILDHKVFVCSGPTLPKIKQELEDLGYRRGWHYDEVISVVDYLVANGTEFEYDEKGDPWTDDETWFKSKGEIAKLNNIHIMIDDSEKYKQFVDKETLFFLVK
jgi:hypothetical protein